MDGLLAVRLGPWDRSASLTAKESLLPGTRRLRIRWPCIVGLLGSLSPFGSLLAIAPFLPGSYRVYQGLVVVAALLPLAFVIFWRHRWRATPDREIAIQMGLLVGSFCTALLLAEGGLRLIAPPSNVDARNKAVNAPDGTYWYYETFINKGRNLANTWGFLGEEPAAGQHATVLLLGDSLPAARLYPANFAAMAEALQVVEGGQPVKIYNASFGGYSLDQIRRFYQERLAGLPHDVAIFALYVDDLNRELRYQKDNQLYSPIVPEWIQTLLWNSELAARLTDALGVGRVPLMRLRRFSLKQRLDEGLTWVGEMRRTAEARGAQFTIFNIPRFDWDRDLGAVENYRYASFNARFEAWARTQGIPYYDLTPAFVGQSVETLRISKQNIHFTPKGHAFAAHHLVRFLRQLDLPGIERARK